MAEKKGFHLFGYVGRILRGVRIDELKNRWTRHGSEAAGTEFPVFDMLWCAARYGAGYHDYVMFGFYDMDGKHRKTYVTRIKNKSLSPCSTTRTLRTVSTGRPCFTPGFEEFLKRDFLIVEHTDEKAFCEFMENREVLFAKPDVGESGKRASRGCRNPTSRTCTPCIPM